MTFIEELKNSDIWDKMQHISLEEMKTVRLMSRIDTKYVAHQDMLIPILQHAMDNNYMVQYTSHALNAYDTTYFDTEDLSMYVMHHNRKLHRRKIRCRTYTANDTSFLEIKDKNNCGRTKKTRILIDDTDVNYLRENKKVTEFIRKNTPYTFKKLIPALKTDFHRITLVNKNKTERITIDTNLLFSNLMTGINTELKDLVIIELKEDGRFVSTMSVILRELHVKPFHISKYCIGTALTNPDAKQNRFKRKIHLLNKIRNNYE